MAESGAKAFTTLFMTFFSILEIPPQTQEGIERKVEEAAKNFLFMIDGIWTVHPDPLKMFDFLSGDLPIEFEEEMYDRLVSLSDAVKCPRWSLITIVSKPLSFSDIVR